MSERKNERPMTDSRRNFLFRKVPRLAVGGVATVIGIKEAEKIVDPLIRTPHGNFLFLPERHDLPLNPESLPADTDIYFVENAAPAQYLSGNFFDESIDNSHPYKSNLESTKKMAQTVLNRGGFIAWGDLETINPVFENYFTSANKDDSRKRTFLSCFTLIASGLLLIKKNSLEESNEVKVTRRNFLKIASLGLGAAGMTLGSSVFTQLARGLMLSDNTINNALERTILRISSIVEHAQIYDIDIFVRNAYVGLMLLNCGDRFIRDKDVIPKVVFNYGAAHGGIEDFLTLGPDFCRFILNSLPQDLIDKLLVVHDGPQNLSTAVMTAKDDKGNYFYQYVTDKELEKNLKNRQSST